jgi:hypothetical protein
MHAALEHRYIVVVHDFIHLSIYSFLYVIHHHLSSMEATSPTSDARRARRESDRRRAAAKRAAETPQQREARRQAERLRAAARRAARTPEQVAAERERDRIRQQERRAALSANQLARENARGREAHATARGAEDEIQRARRLATDRLQHQRQREAENEVQRARRLATDRLQHQRQRENMEDEERANIAQQNRVQHQTVYAQGGGNRQQYLRPRHMFHYQQLHEPTTQNFEYCVWRRRDVANVANANAGLDARLKPHKLRPQTVCTFCDSDVWPEEYTGRVKCTDEGGRPTTRSYAICCNHGKVKLPKAQRPPDVFANLATGTDPKSRHFRGNARYYNEACTFLTSSIKNAHMAGGGFENVSIQGQISHYFNPLFTVHNCEYKNNFSLFVDTEALNLNESRPWLNKIRGEHRQTLDNIKQWLWANHPMGRAIQQASDRYQQLPDRSRQDIQVTLISPSCVNRTCTSNEARMMEAPQVQEVAAIVSDENSTRSNLRNFFFHFYSQRKPIEIDALHEIYMTLRFPLLFPRGEAGYTPFSYKHRNVKDLDLIEYAPTPRRAHGSGGGDDDSAGGDAEHSDNDADDVSSK